MKEIVGGVIGALFLIGLFNTIYSTAQETADELDLFTQDMSRAMSCATKGISIYTCSPNLNPQNLERLEKDLQDYEMFLKKTKLELENYKNKYTEINSETNLTKNKV